MMDPAGMPSGQLIDRDWQVESWRLTCFVPNPHIAADSNWWAEVVGDAPEARISNPRQASFQEEGPYRGGRLIVSVQPGRVDWGLVGVPLGDDLPLTFPTLGTIADAITGFREVATRWFEFGPSIRRMAVSAVLLQQTEDKDSAYQRIGDYVPGLRLDTPGCSDLLFQINRPRTSAVTPPMRINRLVKWSVAASQVLRLDLPQLTTTLSPPVRFAARAELDINTESERATDLEREQLPDIFDELVGMLLEISQQGDIP